MSQKRFSTGLTPEIFIDQVGGELQVRGFDQAEVVVEGGASDLRVDHQGSILHLACDSNCDVLVPVDAVVHLSAAHSHARLRGLEAPLDIQVVHGSLFLRSVADVRVETVHGELVARQLAGDLKAGTVDGNAVVRDVQGRCQLDEVNGNLELREVEGDVQVAAMGNARIRLSALGGSQYQIKAEGNVHCRLPADASLKLSLVSEADHIYIKLPGGVNLYQEARRELVLGEGAAVMEVIAGGSIYFSAREAGWSDEEEPAGFSPASQELGDQIARQVEAQIEAQMEAMNRQLSEQMANLTASIGRVGLSQEETDRILRQAQESTDRANAQAQEKVRRAQEKIERKLEEARRREEERSRSAARWGARGPRQGWKFEIPMPPVPPVQPVGGHEPVSEDERLLILRMLEQKKISLAEADELLAALEGKER